MLFVYGLKHETGTERKGQTCIIILHVWTCGEFCRGVNTNGVAEVCVFFQKMVTA